MIMKGLNLITAQELALIQGMTPPAEADQEKIDAIDEAGMGSQIRVGRRRQLR